jgi:hypothetical protein
MATSHRIEIARLTEEYPQTGGRVIQTILLMLGTIVMVLAALGEMSAIRLAASGAIWTGWNVLIGSFLAAGRQRILIVTREERNEEP